LNEGSPTLIVSSVTYSQLDATLSQQDSCGPFLRAR
jgi:hypothetical protein